MTTFHLPFHTWLKNRRRALDLSVDELADRAGCSPNTLRKLENGDRRPSRQLAERLAQHLRIAPEELATFLDYARAGISATAPAPHIPSIPAPVTLPAERAAPPRPLTRLIGREALLAEVGRMLSDRCPVLVNLIGPGGVGKTRLAQELAVELHAHFAAGVVFVSLAAVQNPAAAMAAIAQALDLAPDLHRSATMMVRDSLSDRQLLLVLDNLEQVLDIGPSIADLLAHCSQLCVLVTSRVALKVRGEQLVAVPALQLPPATQLPAVEQLAEIPAVALFVERVQAVTPQFRLTEANAAAVAAICARLDGLPLAIELVAARCRLLGPQNLLAQLQTTESKRLFGLLSGGSRDLPERHRTLRAAIEWSYDLLSVAEQQLLRRLACFVGGWDLAAAEAICGEEEIGPADLAGFTALVSPEFLDRFAVLCDSSLVQSVNPTDDEPRFTMLEMLREYGIEQLKQNGEFELLRRRHAHYTLNLAAADPADLNRSKQPARFAHLEREITNVRAALNTLTEDDPTAALNLAGRLWWFWCQRGYWLEGRDWLALLLNRGSATPPEMLAEALVGMGALSFVLADFSAARTHCLHSADIFQSLGDRRGRGYALTFLGMTVLRQGDVAQAQQVLEASVAEFRQTADRWGLAHALNGLRQVFVERADLVGARQIQEESVALWRSVNDAWGLALALNGLGEIARYEGDFMQAADLYAESLRLFQASGDSGNSAILLHNLAHATLAGGDPLRAVALFRQGMQLDHKHGNSEGVLEHLAGLGAAAAAQAQWRRAALLLGYVVAASADHSENFFPVDQKVLRAAITQVDAALGPDTAAIIGAEGRSRSPAEIIAYALSDADT